MGGLSLIANAAGTGTDNTFTGTNTFTGQVNVTDSLFSIRDDADPTKIVQFQASGLTTATTRTITVPDANITLVGLTTSQSLTNKTLDNTNTVTLKDTLFTLQDDGDATKQAVFQLSGITTATTRTYTVPDFSGTLIVDTATTATLGSSTAAVTLNLGASGTLSGNTKTVNLGNGGASGSTTNINIGSGTAGALGTTTIGGPTLNVGSPTVTLNSTTASCTLNLAASVTASGNTKTVNIGVGGASGSTTNITLGSSTSGATNTFVLNTPPTGPNYTVTNLPTATAGRRAFATDASTTLLLGLGTTVTGGGANFVPVYADGTNWKYG